MLIRRSGRLDIFQIQLQGLSPIVFVCFEAIQKVHILWKVRLKMPEPETDRIHGGPALVLQGQLQMFSFGAHGTAGSDSDIP